MTKGVANGRIGEAGRGALRAGAVVVCLFAAFALAALALPRAAHAQAAETPQALIARVLAAYGGADRLAAVKRLHAVGTTSSLRTGTVGPSERWFARPDKLRIDIRHSPERLESRILDGERSWREGTPVAEPFRSAMVLQAARFALPLILMQLPVTDRGERVEGGRALRVLALALPSGMSLEAVIDPASALVVRSRGLAALGGQTLEFGTVYDDFRPVEGVLVPHREQHFAMGMHTGETVLSRIELNPVIAPQVFRP